MCETELREYQKRGESTAPVEDCAVLIAASLSGLQEVVNNLDNSVEHAGIKETMEDMLVLSRMNVDSTPSPQWRSHHDAVTKALGKLVGAAHHCPTVFIHGATFISIHALEIQARLVEPCPHPVTPHSFSHTGAEA